MTLPVSDDRPDEKGEKHMRHSETPKVYFVNEIKYCDIEREGKTYKFCCDSDNEVCLVGVFWRGERATPLAPPAIWSEAVAALSGGGE
jgi:hypothetical protein